MDDNRYLSIVIPLYNAGEFFCNCIDTLLGTEGIEDTEIIIVDDGSDDGSGEAAERYASSHDNITVIHSENKGPSAARNTGLLKASGRYVFFCDADDLVVPDRFTEMIKAARTEECDVILWDADLIDSNGDISEENDRGYFAHRGLPSEEKIYSGRELIGTMLKNSGDFAATIWLSAYRKDYLTDNGFLFEEGLIHEDELWVPKVLLKAENIRYIPGVVYLYRIHPDSIMNPVSEDREHSVRSMMEIYPSLYSYYDSGIEDDKLRDMLKTNLTQRYLHYIFRYRFWRYGYGKQIEKKTLWKTSKRISDKIRVIILYVITAVR